VIPFLDLQAQYRSIKSEIDAAIQRVLDNASFILGTEVAALEEEFAHYSGSQIGIGVNSGTSALHLALLAGGIGVGDEVVTTPYTFIASVAAIRYTGATPVFADIDPRTYNLDPAGIERAITPRTKAIMPVHLYGHPADMDPIVEIVRRRNLLLIEDAAQAHGAEYKGRRVGSIGDMGCFSFYPGKNLGAYGEGGMVVTSNPELARTIRLLRDWGTEKRYHYVLKGYNYRLEGIQAAILRAKLPHLESWTEARRANARWYGDALRDAEEVVAPVEMPYARHVYNVFAIMARRRDAIQSELTARGIHSAIHYPSTVYGMPAHADLGCRPSDFPNAELAAERELSLPIFPELGEERVRAVAAAVASVAVPVR
jgi:dTDP-4-amino-4,6-dideoxygalactose transaminase